LFGFDRLRAAAGERISGDPFERTAVRRLIEDLLAQQTAVTAKVMKMAGSPDVGASREAAHNAAKTWAGRRDDVVAAARDTLAEIEAGGDGWSFAKLTLGAAALRELAGRSKPSGDALPRGAGAELPVPSHPRAGVPHHHPAFVGRRGRPRVAGAASRP